MRLTKKQMACLERYNERRNDFEELKESYKKMTFLPLSEKILKMFEDRMNAAKEDWLKVVQKLSLKEW